MNDVLKYVSKSLSSASIDKFQCAYSQSTLYEMNMEGTDLSLIRTTIDNRLYITIINNQRKADISLNSVDETSIDKAIESVIELSLTSQQDPDYDIADYQAHQTFSKGPLKPDTEKMYTLMKEFSGDVEKLFPEVKLSETVFSHNYTKTNIVNSNSVDFDTEKGVYRFYSLFSSKNDDKTSSFNYTGFSLGDVETSLLQNGSLKDLLKQSIEQLDTKTLEGKFVGDIVITPDCLDDMLYSYASTFLGDRALITGLSIFKESLGQKIANSKLTVHSMPLSSEIYDGYFVTPDGFAAENITLIEKGVLKSFLLSQYGSNKTKLERAKNSGGCFVIEPGEKPIKEIIKGVKKGLLFARYSGGMPSANGDFSGIAKNSFLIEDGEIKYPVSEVMISGNLADLFKNINEISKEQINFGSSIYPYLHTSGVTISGK